MSDVKGLPDPQGQIDREKDATQGTEFQPKSSVDDIASVPDGGLTAWLQVLGSFFIFSNTWGILNTFGAYQTYYEMGDLFSATSSQISWIGSVQSSLLLVIGLGTGPLYDAGYFRSVICTGSFLVVFGQMMISVSHEYYQVLLAQGFCMGVGVGLLFVPGVAILSTYFTLRLALVNGITALGSAVGGIISPIVFRRLCTQIGFAWTTRVLGLLILITQLIPILVFRVRVTPSSKRKVVDWSALTEPPFALFILGETIIYISINIPFFYLQNFAIDTGIAPEGELAFYLLSISTAGSVAGRVFPNFFANRLGPFNIFSACAVICAGLIFAMINLSSLSGILAIAVLYGFFSGALVSLPPTCYVKLSPDRGVIGTRMGMGYAVAAVGNLIGPPIAGAIVGGRGFNAMWAFAGTMSLTGGVVAAMSRSVQVQWKVFARV